MPYVAPAAHMNVTTLYGIVLPDDAQAQSTERTQSAEPVKTMGEDGEILKLQCAPLVKEEIKIDYVGAPNFAAVASAGGIDPAVATPISAGMTENNSKANAGTVSATKFTDLGDAGASVGVGAGDTDIGTIVIKSVVTSLVESVQRDVKVNEVMVPGTDGKASTGFRGQAAREGSFSVRFKGDIFAGIVLGIGGASLYAFTTGIRAVTKLMENQKTGDVNGGEYSGEWAPVAA